MTRGAVLLMCVWLGGCDVALPIPAEFDAAFAHGLVCMPSNATTGADEVIPVRFDFCLYRCLTLDGEQRLRSAWACSGPVCELTLLATTHVLRVDSESDCDGRDIEDPAASECSDVSVEILMSPPRDDEGEFQTGDFTVRIPYLTLDDAKAVLKRVDAGEPVGPAVQEVIGVQRHANRQFTINIDPANASVASTAELGDEDCHAIPLP